MGGNQTSAISFNRGILENLFYCLVTRNNWSIRNINEIGFIMISVSVHVVFTSVKVMHLSCYFSYWPHP